MCSDYLMLKEDQSTFEAQNSHKYYQNCMKYMSTHKKWANGNINSNIFYKILKAFTQIQKH